MSFIASVNEKLLRFIAQLSLFLRQSLIIFGDIIADIISSKTNSAIVTEGSRKLNFCTVFIRQPFFQVSNDVRIKLYTFFY